MQTPKVFEEVQVADKPANIMTHINMVQTQPSPEEILKKRQLPPARPWSQVFELNYQGSYLSCLVQENEMILQLIHLTDEPIQAYQQALQQDQNRSRFAQAESSKRIQQRFENYASAKVVFDGNVVNSANLVFNVIEGTTQEYPFTLNIATSTLKLYQVHFKPWFFKEKETIEVNFVNNIDFPHLRDEHYHLTTFNMIEQQSDHVMVFGLKMSPQLIPDVNNDIGMTLQVIYPGAGKEVDFCRRGSRLTNVTSMVRKMTSELGKSLILKSQELTERLGNRIVNRAHQFHGDKPKVAPIRTDSQSTVNVLRGDEKGVVAVHFIQEVNSLCVVFSDGTMRVRSLDLHRSLSGTNIELVDINLLAVDGAPEFLKQFSASSSIPSFKLSGAHITHSSLEGSRIILNLATEVQNELDLRKVWRVTKYELEINELIKGDNQDGLHQLGLSDLEETHDQDCQVKHLLTEQSGSEATTYVYFWNQKRSQGWFRKMSGAACAPLLIDSQLQANITDVFDQLSDEQLILAEIPTGDFASEGANQLKEQLEKQILSLYRFHPVAIQEAMRTAVSNWQGRSRESIQLSLQTILRKFSIENVMKLRKRIRSQQDVRSSAFAIECTPCLNLRSSFEGHTTKVKVSDLGFSLFREIEKTANNSGVSSLLGLAHSIQCRVEEIFQVVERFQQSIFKSSEVIDVSREILNGGQSNQSPLAVLVNLAACLHLLTCSHSFRIRESTLADPDMMEAYFSNAFSEGNKFSQLHVAVQQFISEQYETIQNALKEVQSGFLEYFENDLQALSSFNPESNYSFQMTGEMKAMTEKSILRDLDLLSSLPLSFMMIKSYISFFGIHSNQPELNQILEQDQANASSSGSSQTEVDNQVKSRYLQLLALLQAFSTQIPEAPTNKSLLTDIISGNTSLQDSIQAVTFNSDSEVLPIDLVLTTFLRSPHGSSVNFDLVRHMQEMSQESFAPNKYEIYVQAFCQYLKLLPTQTDKDLLMEFFRAFSLAKLFHLSEVKPDKWRGTLDKQEILTLFSTHLTSFVSILTSEEFESTLNAMNLSELIISPMEESTQRQIKEVARGNKVYATILIAAEQLKTFDSSVLSLQLLTKGLDHLEGDLDIWKASALKEHFLCSIFDCCKTGTEEELRIMHQVAHQIRPVAEGGSENLRVHYLHKFMQRVITEKGTAEPLLNFLIVNRKDLDQVLKFGLQRLSSLIDKRKPHLDSKKQVDLVMSSGVNAGADELRSLEDSIEAFTLPSAVVQEITAQVRVLEALVQIYQEVASDAAGSLWRSVVSFEAAYLKEVCKLNSKFEDVVLSVNQTTLNGVRDAQHLERIEGALSKLNTDYVSLKGEIAKLLVLCFKLINSHESQAQREPFYLVDSSEVQPLRDEAVGTSSGAGKRNSMEIQAQGKEQLVADSLQHSIPKTIFDVDEKSLLGGHRVEPLRGSLSRVYQEQAEAEELLCEGQLAAIKAGFFLEGAAFEDRRQYLQDEGERVVSILGELGAFSLATKLGEALKSEAAAVSITQEAAWLRSLKNINPEDYSEKDFASQDSELLRILASAGPKIEEGPIDQYVSKMIESHLPRLTSSALLRLAHLLIADHVELPLSLSKQLTAMGMTPAVVEAYLAFGLRESTSGLVNFLQQDSPGQLKRNVRVLLESDSHYSTLPSVLKEVFTTLEEGVAGMAEPVDIMNNQGQLPDLGGLYSAEEREELLLISKLESEASAKAEPPKEQENASHKKLQQLQVEVEEGKQLVQVLERAMNETSREMRK